MAERWHAGTVLGVLLGDRLIFSLIFSWAGRRMKSGHAFAFVGVGRPLGDDVQFAATEIALDDARIDLVVFDQQDTNLVVG